MVTTADAITVQGWEGGKHTVKVEGTSFVVDGKKSPTLNVLGWNKSRWAAKLFE